MRCDFDKYAENEKCSRTVAPSTIKYTSNKSRQNSISYSLKANMTPITCRRKLFKIDSCKNISKNMNLNAENCIPDPCINLISRLNKLVCEESYSERCRTTRDKKKNAALFTKVNLNLSSVVENLNLSRQMNQQKSKHTKISSVLTNVTKRRLNKIIYGV